MGESGPWVRIGWSWWTSVGSNWVREVSELGRLVARLGESWSEWNTVQSAQIGSRMDLSRKKSALKMTWVGTNRLSKNDLGRNKSALEKTCTGINRLLEGLWLAPVNAELTWVRTN